MAKRQKKNYEGIDREQTYSIDQAVKMVKERATAKFDETVEISMNLNIDARKADQLVRGVMQLPHGTGKSYRVAVFARDAKADEAKAAGADIVGAEELMQQIQKGEMNFDRCIATPDMMGLVGRVGKILGPRGLMPNPKLGTVTLDVAEAIKAVKGGQLEYRNEKAGLIQAGIGKASFDEKKLLENVKFFVDTINKARPSGAKGKFVKKMSLSSTMGVGVRFEIVEA